MAGHRREDGFTLVETLVALAILGVVLSTVFAVFGNGLRGAHRDEDRLLLALVAQNLLARSRLDYLPDDGALSGDIGDGLRWRIESEPYELPEGLLPEAPEEPDLLGPAEGAGAASGRGGLAREARPDSGLDTDAARASLAERAGQERPGTGAGGLGGEETAAAEGEGSPFGETETRREPVRLRLVRVTVEKGGLSYELAGLATEPQRDRR